MVKGFEGLSKWNRGAETDLIRKEYSARTPESLIATQRKLAQDAVRYGRLTAVLQGEESIPFIAHNKDPQRQLDMAEALLLKTSFLRKLMPPQLDEKEQAAFIVNLAQEMEQEKQTLN
jgi:hypothetical protein